jgi:hypothetical protein
MAAGDAGQIEPGPFFIASDPAPNVEAKHWGESVSAG